MTNFFTAASVGADVGDGAPRGDGIFSIFVRDVLTPFSRDKTRLPDIDLIVTFFVLFTEVTRLFVFNLRL